MLTMDDETKTFFVQYRWYFKRYEITVWLNQNILLYIYGLQRVELYILQWQWYRPTDRIYRDKKDVQTEIQFTY